MKIFRLIVFCGGPLMSTQSIGQPAAGKLHTSLYLCPLQPVMTPLPNYRFGLEQSLSQKVAVFGDYSFFRPNTINFKGLKGERYDLGLKYFYKTGPDQVGNYKNLFWMSGLYSFEQQSVKLDVSNKSTGSMENQELHRKVQRFNLGTGVNLIYKKWSIDLGLRLGVKKRDVDVAGFSEAEDNAFHVPNGNYMRVTFWTDEQYFPDLLLLFRLGYSIFYFKA